MAIRREGEQRYARFWRSLRNFLLSSSGFPVSGAARRGSRHWGTHHNKSDLDIIFAISRDPSKKEVYPPIIERIKSTLRVNANVGESYNAIKIWKEGISCHLVLRTQVEFRAHLNSGQYQESD